MQKSIRKYLVIVTLICSSLNVCKPIEQENEPWINVFIHGIVGMDAQTCLSHAFQFFTDCIAHTRYARSVEIMRADPFFGKNQAMQNVGLVPIDVNNHEAGYASAAIARTHNHVASLCPIQQTNYYYTFGWSGLLSLKARYQEAKHLYKALVNLKKDYLKQGINPKLRLFGYSHGCNVILNLGALAQKEPYASMPLEIDELILLGAPIQRQTARYVTSPIFKKIYNFYSRSDHIQKKDLFSTQQLFSKRVFANRHEWSLPSSLTQIEVKILKERPNQRKKWHITSESVIHPAGNISKRRVVRGNSRSLQNVSPGHTELWFMAWTPRNYRADFPLYPVPLLTATPYIIQMIESTQPQSKTSRKIVADIRPDYNYMILRHRFPKKQPTIVPFLSKNTYKELHDLAMLNKPPEGYTKEEHDNRRTLAKTQAHKDIRERRRNRRNLRHR